MGNCLSSTPARAPPPPRSPRAHPPDGHRSNASLTHTGALGPASARSKRAFKLLLLGSGESGKSTISKQIKIIHKDGFPHHELLYYRRVVAKNLAESAQTIALALVKYELQPPDTPTRLAIQKILNFSVHPPADTASGGELGAKASDPAKDRGAETIAPTPTPTPAPAPVPSDVNAKAGAGADGTRPRSTDTPNPLTPEIGCYAQQIWAAPATRTLLSLHRDKFYLMDSAAYFFEHARRISSPAYLPTNDDVLRARSKSTAITETTFAMGNLLIHLFDVGGQRSERFKWIHSFEAVSSIIFCVAISEYDQVLLEDPTQNRLDESLVLFESVVNSRWFARSSVILFLNKVDIFRRKITRVPLSDTCPDYTGGPDVQKAARYVLWRFTQLNRAKLPIYPHLTQATDTQGIEQVFMDIKDSIVQNALRETALL